MDKTIEADLYRHFGLHGFRGLIKGLSYPGFRYTFLLRKVASHGSKSLSGLLFRFLLQRYRFKYGFEISPEAKIGDGFYLTSHCGSVIIGPVRIGRNCNIGHCVTIGRGITGERKGRPTLGDNVWIGTGSVLVGKINIGNNVLIAPNSFVNFDVPDNSLIIGNPGVIIKKENPTEGYINYTV